MKPLLYHHLVNNGRISLQSIAVREELETVASLLNGIPDLSFFFDHSYY